MNYFIDTNHLEIPDKNIFTAKELRYLIPVYNEKMYEKILDKNSWSRFFLPNFYREDHSVMAEKKNPIKSFSERIFSGWPGGKLDSFCMKITETFWKIKFRKIRQNDDIRIRCQKHVSKFHPRNYQVKVLERYREKIVHFESLNNVILE